MTPIRNPQELIEAFGSPGAPYFSTVAFNDGTTGFSIRRHYPTNIRFKPAVDANGVPDDVALIRIIYKVNRMNAATGNVPVLMDIGRMSVYVAKNWDYEFDDSSCPTRESVATSRKSPQPLNASLNGEFVYSPSTGVFLTVEGVEVSGSQILDRAFEYHCDTVHPIKGLKARSEVAFHEGIHGGLNKVEAVLVWTLKHIFGRERGTSPAPSVLPKSYALADFERVQEDTIELAGYKASKRIVFLFALLVAGMAYWLLPAEHGTYLKSLVESEFLLILHALILLVALDEGVPRVLFWGVNLVLRVRRWYFLWGWKKSS